MLQALELLEKLAGEPHLLKLHPVASADEDRNIGVILEKLSNLSPAKFRVHLAAMDQTSLSRSAPAAGKPRQLNAEDCTRLWLYHQASVLSALVESVVKHNEGKIPDRVAENAALQAFFDRYNHRKTDMPPGLDSSHRR